MQIFYGLSICVLAFRVAEGYFQNEPPLEPLSPFRSFMGHSDLVPESRLGLYTSRTGPLGKTPFYLQYQPQIYQPQHQPIAVPGNYYPQARSADDHWLDSYEPTRHISLEQMMRPLHRPVFENMGEWITDEVETRLPNMMTGPPYQF